jgi:hypothetical protein
MTWSIEATTRNQKRIELMSLAQREEEIIPRSEEKSSLSWTEFAAMKTVSSYTSDSPSRPGGWGTLIKSRIVGITLSTEKRVCEISRPPT